MLKANDPFFQVPQTTRKTSAGDVQLPILYFDASALYGFFLVEKQKVDSLLAGTGLEADLVMGNYSIAGIACYEYRDTSVGVYNEVGLAVTASPVGQGKPVGSWWDFLSTLTNPEVRHTGMHVLHLPVTTEAANAAGREIWGFPKFVTPITYQESGKTMDCRVYDPDQGVGEQLIMALAGNLGPGLPARPLSLTLFTRLEQALLRSTVNARGKSRLTMPGSLRLTVGDSQHPMAQTLRELGLANARPLAVVYSDCFQSRLNAGYCLAELPAAAGSAGLVAVNG